MKEKPANQFIPLVTSTAGGCLTMANWQRTGVDCGAFYLDELLMKPGIAVLQGLTDLKGYYAWPGKVLLNVQMPKQNAQGFYRIRSRYDGEAIDMDPSSLFSLICQLKPDYLVLSATIFPEFEGLRLHFPETIKVCVVAEEFNAFAGKFAGYYRDFQATECFSDLLQALKNQPQPCCLSGDFDRDQLKILADFKQVWVESDRPANDAMAGRIYDREGVFNLLESDYEYQFHPLAEGCRCDTCAQGLTRAYLHHLLQQTPLLCQRFLIQHNVWVCSNHY